MLNGTFDHDTSFCFFTVHWSNFQDKETSCEWKPSNRWSPFSLACSKSTCVKMKMRFKSHQQKAAKFVRKYIRQARETMIVALHELVRHRFWNAGASAGTSWLLEAQSQSFLERGRRPAFPTVAWFPCRRDKRRLGAEVSKCCRSVLMLMGECYRSNR